MSEDPRDLARDLVLFAELIERRGVTAGVLRRVDRRHRADNAVIVAAAQHRLRAARLSKPLVSPVPISATKLASRLRC